MKLKENTLPLKDVTIAALYGDSNVTYEIPIYQRNYAWEKDEITALVQDVFDAWSDKRPDRNTEYYIGTLVTYDKGDNVYEVIDGQQRLTTIKLVLKALQQRLNEKDSAFDKSKLTYRARKKSSDALKDLPDKEERVVGGSIKSGFEFAKIALKDLFEKNQDKEREFRNYFLNHVHIIHYKVPKDIDLNHYFEIMNSRGEQLEKHEIMKARLMNVLNEADRSTFNKIWEACSDLRAYIQQKYPGSKYVWNDQMQFCAETPDSLFETQPSAEGQVTSCTIRSLLEATVVPEETREKTMLGTFQPIIDFPNFLLIVLKLTLMRNSTLCADQCDMADFKLDDKELIGEFTHAKLEEGFVKQFAYNLLKARYLLDNYVVHHANVEDTVENKPWKLQHWKQDADGKSAHPKNLVGDGEDEENTQGNSENIQGHLVRLLSMFEVSYTARQRKNYLLYCLLYLFEQDKIEAKDYKKFVEELAKKYFVDVYLHIAGAGDTNALSSYRFDDFLLKDGKVNVEVQNNPEHATNYRDEMMRWFGTDKAASSGVPLFVFNYLDYKVWELYDKTLRNKDTKKTSESRIQFFATLGCSDFDLDPFSQFYFSRTRRSLEHYYPQALANGENNAPTQLQINCFGNYAMISSEANSSGSNWTPYAKIEHYLKNPKRINPLGVASLKFRIMMQICEDNHGNASGDPEWTFDDMQKHQKKMIELLLG